MHRFNRSNRFNSPRARGEKSSPLNMEVGETNRLNRSKRCDARTLASTAEAGPPTADPLDAADPQQAARCRALWAAVALRAINDAEADPVAHVAYLGSRDFATVACLAGLDPDALQARIAALARDRLEAARAAQEAELTKGRRATKETST